MASKDGAFENTKMIYAYLKARGIPKPIVDRIRKTLAEDALVDGKMLAYNRIYTAVALMLRRHLGFGRKRIIDALHAFDDICGSVLDEDREWAEIMQELDDETGLIIRCGDDGNVLCEYQQENEVDVNE